MYTAPGVCYSCFSSDCQRNLKAAGGSCPGTKLVLLPLVVRAPFRAARRSGSCRSHKIIKPNAREAPTARTHGAGEKAAK